MPTVAITLLRRPGAGTLTAVLAAVLAMPFAPTGAGGFQAMGAVMVGVLLESPYLLTRFRRFPRVFAVSGALLVAALLVGVHGVLWGMSSMTPLAAAMMIGGVTAGAVLWSLVGSVIGARLRAIGVARIARPAATR